MTKLLMHFSCARQRRYQFIGRSLTNWWSYELDYLKDRAIESDQFWQAAGRPRSGVTTRRPNTDEGAYHSAIRNNRRQSDTFRYLHEALLCKHGTDFWNSWNSKLNTKSTCPPQVDRVVDSYQIATKFEPPFTVSYANLTNEDTDKLSTNYLSQRGDYVGSFLLHAERFDAAAVENIINDMILGKTRWFV